MIDPFRVLKYRGVDGISQNYKYHILATILHTMTGVPVRENVSLDASAVSDSGLSVCCASLLNPNMPPMGKATFHLIPGHIQKEGALFGEMYDLDPTPGIRIEEDTMINSHSTRNYR